jgi:hypothetical protein
MMCTIDSTCPSKHAKLFFRFVGLNRFAVQNILVGSNTYFLETPVQLRPIECTVSYESKNQGRFRSGSRTDLHAALREKQGRTSTDGISTAGRYLHRRQKVS